MATVFKLTPILLKKYYHYTTKEGYEGILATGVIRPSLKSSQRDANFGDGVYLTTITPKEISMSDESTTLKFAIELFGVAAESDNLDYFFELSLAESKVTNFIQLFLELGEDPNTLQPKDIRRICLYKTKSNLEIGESLHGKTPREHF